MDTTEYYPLKKFYSKNVTYFLFTEIDCFNHNEIMPVYLGKRN